MCGLQFENLGELEKAFLAHDRYTVPDRSNLTGNALLERKWNAKWNAAGTPKERPNFCGVGARSIENAITRSIENAITRSIENLWLA